MQNFSKNIILWIVIGLLLIALFNLFQGNSSNRSTPQISFSDFISAIDSGNISEVDIKGNYIEGFFEDGRNFSTYSPNYPNLVEKLSEKGVRINAEPNDKGMHPILRLMDAAKKNPDVKVVLLCKKVKDLKRYGVPTIEKLSDKIFSVKEVIEKPEHPKSKYGILPLYYFKSDIFESLKKIKPGKGKEFQLTDAIQDLIQKKQQVLAIPLNKNEEEIDVGTVESYKNAQEMTFRKAWFRYWW